MALLWFRFFETDDLAVDALWYDSGAILDEMGEPETKEEEEDADGGDGGSQDHLRPRSPDSIERMLDEGDARSAFMIMDEARQADHDDE